MNEDLPIRKKLVHTTPAWVSAADIFFITINGRPRGINQFANRKTATCIINSAIHHHEKLNWFCRLLVIMPDHLHVLAAFPECTSMKTFVSAWKGYLVKTCDIQWQRDFFDHRIRSWESLDAKADYVRQNPVRAGLAKTYTDWPWKWDVSKE